MDNSQFRKLLFSEPSKDASTTKAGAPSTLGAKKTSFVPMTPRPGSNVSNSDFARQAREQYGAFQPKKTKQFKSSVPKGSKFAAGYVDRAKARAEAVGDEDDRAERIKALEDQVKLGQLPQETFEALRDEIIGSEGDISSTHLVKGLDWKLLERVRRGENVFENGSDTIKDAPPDVDEEFDDLEEQTVETVKKEKAEKKGNVAPVTGVKRSRDAIMAELKAQRKAAAEAAFATTPVLDSKWRKVGDNSRPRIEIDHKGREVLITVDEDGIVKKKIRKVPAASASTVNENLPILGADANVPQMSLPEATIPDDDDDEDDDIFAGVGADYNPLAAEGEEGDSTDSEDEQSSKALQPPTILDNPVSERVEDSHGRESSKPMISANTARNYFNDVPSATTETKEDRFKGIEAVLHKAAKLYAAESLDSEHDGESKAGRDERSAKRARMLANSDRDMDDMDLGFGGSRFDDEDDEGGDGKIRLSEWKGRAAMADDDLEKHMKGDRKKRKPKKRKGDVNNAADVMRVIEGRKAVPSK